MVEPYTLTLAEMIATIRKKKLSPVELAESLLARIDSLESSVKAWVTIHRTSLLKEARRCQEELARGKFRGPLHGIPIGVKDIFYTAGIRTTGGSKIFEKFIPDFDATAVVRLKKAGALVLGKTATTEFARPTPPRPAIPGIWSIPPEARAAVPRRRWRLPCAPEPLGPKPEDRSCVRQPIAESWD